MSALRSQVLNSDFSVVGHQDANPSSLAKMFGPTVRAAFEFGLVRSRTIHWRMVWCSINALSSNHQRSIAMFRRSFTVANVTRVVLLATTLSVSACSSFDPGSQMVTDASNQTVPVADPPAHREGPPVSYSDPSASSAPRPAHYYYPD